MTDKNNCNHKKKPGKHQNQKGTEKNPKKKQNPAHVNQNEAFNNFVLTLIFFCFFVFLGGVVFFVVFFGGSIVFAY